MYENFFIGIAELNLKLQEDGGDLPELTILYPGPVTSTWDNYYSLIITTKEYSEPFIVRRSQVKGLGLFGYFDQDTAINAIEDIYENFERSLQWILDELELWCDLPTTKTSYENDLTYLHILSTVEEAIKKARRLKSHQILIYDKNIN